MSTYAIIESGSKQYRVEPKTVFTVEKMEIPEKKKEIALEKVLLVRDGDKLQIGDPWVKGASVICDYLGQTRDKKKISLKYRRRKASRRIHGHRQDLTKLLVKEIKIEG